MVWPTIAVIDNYDSFTFNLIHYLEMITGRIPAFFRNQVSAEALNCYDALLFSPGPGLPSEAGNMNDLINHFAGTKKILGVCLGHQAIGQVFGARLSNLSQVLHGVKKKVSHQGHLLFSGIPSPFETGHYHSWIISRHSFPDSLIITASDEQDNIMAIAHCRYDIQGIQFHPESVMTPYGLRLLENWLKH
jgi:anthranilate synthase component 2